ncbi:TIGR03086 family metal-binding protein [Blastococcus haudaquaticus]|uniref:TIGR03086 family protein n=1 Tax=Blastococcus haudaquaticus TaxID=1938745 RepID=A0A286H6Z7_9ACTN|nr:TIGR03086 family metal-binding protein [Blastococcus haudaquaticus]SOE03537.1 TIGR03086 family protein [Blastococcus haudaquaticus]
MQTTTLDLGPQTAEVTRIVAGVREDQLCHPTPCTGMNVAALLDHLVGLTVAFRRAAEKAEGTGGQEPDAANLVPDWRTRLPAQLEALATAWRDADAWDGMTTIAGMEMPAADVGLVGINEVLVHGWDLAVATGKEYRADPATAQACLAYNLGFAAGAPEMRDQIYGPVVPVPDDAPAFDRVLGQTGRDPDWATG